MPSSQWCVLTVGTIGIVRCYIHIRRGASALLVSMDRAILRSLKSEASDSIRLHVFFLFYGYKKPVAHNFNLLPMNKGCYDKWVEDVCAFLEETAPQLGGKGGRCCSVMQSKPVLDKRPDVVFLGYNAHEDWGFTTVDRNRFYEGNPFFYGNNGQARYKAPWRVWYKLYDAMKWAGCTKPMNDGNFVFMNAVYFGSATIRQLESLPNSKSAIEKCLQLTQRLLLEIFRPKCIVCFSVQNCFNLIDKQFKFANVTTIRPQRIVDGKQLVAKHLVKTGYWDGIKIVGIPHPSLPISNDDWGTIALFLKNEIYE